MFKPTLNKNKGHAPPGNGIKKRETAAFGIKYEKAPSKPNKAPEAPNEATAKDVLIIVGTAREKNDEKTAEFKYNIKKLDAPIAEAKLVPKEKSMSMLNKRWNGS